MSFSSDVKQELSGQMSHKRHCQIAEAAAVFAACGQIGEEGGRTAAVLQTENPVVARKYFSLVRRAFGCCPGITVRRVPGKRRRGFYVLKAVGAPAEELLRGLRMIGENGEILCKDGVCDPELFRRTCCRRAFLRGAFLASGSISNPEKAYHYELVCLTRERAEQLRELMRTFDIDARTVCRKKHYVVYVKEGSQLVDLLNIMEAHNALMDLENVRIIREISGTVNRKVNCETANINKTVSAAVQQINDILYLRDRIGFDRLPEGVAEAAQARLDRPEASLKELGDSMDPPVGKSGMNHRLRRIRELANSFRQEEEHYDTANGNDVCEASGRAQSAGHPGAGSQSV